MSTTWLSSPLSTPVGRLRCGLGESQGPRRSRCRMLGGFSCRENAKRVDVLERLVSRHNGGRGLERLNIVDIDSYTALEMKSVVDAHPTVCHCILLCNMYAFIRPRCATCQLYRTHFSCTCLPGFSFDLSVVLCIPTHL